MPHSASRQAGLLPGSSSDETPSAAAPSVTTLYPIEQTPVVVRMVDSESALRAAVQVRHRAYARHLPELAESLQEPEPLDRQPGVAVLLVERKDDGEPVGTMRIQLSRPGPLALAGSIEMPHWLRGQLLAEATRLAIDASGRHRRLVKAMLFKAFYRHCLQCAVDWMVITARPPLDRQYESLLFVDVFPGQPPIAMRHVGNVPHRVLAFEMATADRRWREAGHPLYGFFCRTVHPDVRVGLPMGAGSGPTEG